MRAEVARIQRRLGVATLYVTHDQVEAMTMGDRVAVMRAGVLQQCESPQALYDNPRNTFVAAFIGSPAMNLFEGTLSESAREVKLGSQVIALPDAVRSARPALAKYASTTVVVGIRPEDLPVAGPGSRQGASISSDMATLSGEVELVEALGSELLVHFSTDARRVEAEDAKGDDAEGITTGALSRRGEAVARVEPRADVHAGQRSSFQLDPRRLHFFDAGSGEAIRD
jgi:multiple sugar transport system ATP-binding protein